MNIRTAILKAAASIEQNPHLFDFNSVGIPDQCGMPGCALGWIRLHLNAVAHKSLIETAKSIGCPKMGSCGRGKEGQQLESYGFYRQMETVYGSGAWKDSAPECAKALRLYADKYHPEVSVIPESVMAIFKPEQVAA